MYLNYNEIFEQIELKVKHLRKLSGNLILSLEAIWIILGCFQAGLGTGVYFAAFLKMNIIVMMMVTQMPGFPFHVLTGA